MVKGPFITERRRVKRSYGTAVQGVIEGFATDTVIRKDGVSAAILK
jgi:hypothetical protein